MTADSDVLFHYYTKTAIDSIHTEDLTFQILSKMGKKDYTAFISYSHDDAYWADNIQNKLEHFYIPVALRESNPDIPSTVRPVFKDDTDLTPGVLSQRINDALDRSSYLIVICSKSSAKSEWVNKEVEHFIAQGKASHIIPLVLGNPDGEADARRFMPPALRDISSEGELLWVNVLNEGLERTVVKIIAVILNVSFDSLWQRHLKERLHRRRRRTFWISLGVIAFAALAVFGIVQYSRLKNIELSAEQVKVAGQSLELARKGELINAFKLLTSDECRYLDQYNGKIDRSLRYTIDAYERPGWVCVWQGHVVISDRKNARDTIDIPKSENTLDACLSPSGKLAAYRTAADDKISQLTVIERKSGKTLFETRVPRPILDPILAVSFELTDDNRLILAVNGVVSISDVRTGRTQHKFTYADDGTTPFVKMLSDRLLMLYDIDENYLIYDIDKGKSLMTFNNPAERPKYAFSDDDGTKLCLVDEYGDAKIYRFNSSYKSLIRPKILALSPDGSRFASIDSLGRIQVRTTLPDSLVATLFKTDRENTPLIGFIPGNKQIVTADFNGFKVIDIGSGKVLLSKSFKGKYPYALSGDASCIFFFDEEYRNYSYKISDDTFTPVHSEGQNFAFPNYDGSFYLCFGNSGEKKLELWKTGDDKPSRILQLYNVYMPTSVSVDAEGKYAAVSHFSSTDDGTMTVVDIISLTDGTTVARLSRDRDYDRDCWFRFIDNGIAVASEADGDANRSTLTFRHWYSYAELKVRALEILRDNRGL